MNGVTSRLWAAIKNISSTESGFIDGVTAGTRTASKAAVVGSDGKIDAWDATSLKQGGNTIAYNNNLVETDGTTKACSTNGVTLVTGGAGIADLTLAAPSAGARAVIRVASLSSGSVVVTCASGVTVDGTNDVMTFDAAEETIELMYKSATEWAIVRNDGAVALSTSA